jgi:O-antigen/teichoic acid export membrane protein
MIERVRRLIAHRFVQDTAVLQIGAGLGMIVQAAAGVLVARILAPDLFGQYSLAFSVASIATLLLGSGVADAIAPTVSRAWAQADMAGVRQAYGFFAKFMGAAALLTTVIILCLPIVTKQVYGTVMIGQAAGIVVIASLISATVFTLTQLSLQVAGRIRALAGLSFSDGVVRYTAVLALAATFGFYGAASGHLVGALITAIIATTLFNRLGRLHALLPRLQKMPALARATSWRPLLGPTLWVMADRNLAMLYGALPVAMVGLYATSTEVAYFKLAFGYMILALGLLGPISTLLNVKFPTLQVAHRAHLLPAFLRVTFYATGLSTAVTIGVLALAPLVFRMLYGQEYLPAVPYVWGFGIFGAFFGLGVGLGPLWRAVDRVRMSILINLAVLSTGVPLGIWLMTQWHLWGAVAMVTLWYTSSHVISFWYLVRLLQRERLVATMEIA